MDFQLTSAQIELRGSARRFAEEELRPLAAKWDEEERSPEPDDPPGGGARLSRPDHSQGRRRRPWSGRSGAGDRGVGARPRQHRRDRLRRLDRPDFEAIAHFGTEEQRREILPKAARGELLMGIAITEPHAGSGATDMHSRAAIEGDEIVINGTQGVRRGHSRHGVVPRVRQIR